MQINAINSVNFSASRKKQAESTEQKAPDYERHAENVEKANNDISPLTCVIGIATGLATLKGGNKVVGVARRAAAGAGEAISTGAVKLAKKVKKSINLEECTASIQKFFKKLSTDGAENKEGLTVGLEKLVNRIFSGVDENGAIIDAGKGKEFIERLNKNGIKLNGASLFDNAIAAGAAYVAMDGMSDATESIIDRKKIEKSAIENLGLLMG